MQVPYPVFKNSSDILFKHSWREGDITEEAEWPFNFTGDHPNTVSEGLKWPM